MAGEDCASALETTSPYLTTEEAAKYLRLTARALVHFRSDGGGPVYRKHGARVVYHLDDLNRWSASRRYADTGAVAGRLNGQEPDAHP